MKTAHIFDTETTALIQNSVMNIKHQPRVIEYYGHTIDVETGETIDELEFICDPGVPVTPEITRITGLNPDDVRGKPPFAEHAYAVRRIIEAAGAVVAHNLSYDFAVISTEFSRNHLSCSWPIIRVCTVENTEHLKGYRLSLSALHEHLFGVSFAGAHRAREDVVATTRCFLELRKRGEL